MGQRRAASFAGRVFKVILSRALRAVALAGGGAVESGGDGPVRKSTMTRHGKPVLCYQDYMTNGFMKSLAKLVLLAGAALSAGCVVVDGSPQPGDAVDARFALTWQVNWADTGEDVGDCTAIGADAVRVISTNISTRDVFIDVYDCRDGEGATAPVNVGDYDVNVELDACFGDPDCSDPEVLSFSDTLGPFYMDRAGYTDLGHVVFLVQ